MERKNATELQDDVVDRAYAKVKEGKDVFIEGPTGSGKTREYCRLADRMAEEDGMKVLVLAHRRNLIGQGAKSFARWNGRDDTSIGMNGEIDQEGRIVFSTVQTAAERAAELDRYDAVIVDEGHNATARNKEYGEVIAALERRNPNLVLIAASATPPEMMEGLHPRLQKAEKVIATFEEVIEARLVSLPQTKTPSTLLKSGRSIADVVEAHRRNANSADFETGIGAEIRKNLPEDWIDHVAYNYDRHLADRKTLAFFDSIKDCERFAEAASRWGVKIETLHSGQSDRRNDEILQSFREGRLRSVASVDMISEGYDVPDCDGLLLAKLTTSSKEYRQIIGRGSRAQGQERERETLLVDMGASTYIHGDIAAQAAVQSLRGNLERNVVSNEDLLPDRSSGRFTPWVPLATEAGKPPVFATSIDGAIIYAAPTDKGYAAMASVTGNKGSRLELLQVEGSRKGLIEHERFGQWIGDAIRRNERAIARMVASDGKTRSRLEEIVSRDWERNRGSVARSVEMLTSMPLSMKQAAMSAGRNLAR